MGYNLGMFNSAACLSNRSSMLLNLGLSPVSNHLLENSRTFEDEPKFPLEVHVCNNCGLSQLTHFLGKESLFPADYAYFSSYSESWLEHCKKYTDQLIESEKLEPKDLVIEIASNDGYLLKNFVNAGINALGIEPTLNTANVAINQNKVPTLIDFFSAELASRLKRDNKVPKLLIANNVLAHVPDIRDFVEGISILLGAESIATIEFPHFYNLLRNTEFDTIYHEHYSYINLHPLKSLLSEFNLEVFYVEQIPTHGGSLRVYVAQHGARKVDKSVGQVLNLETELDPQLESIRVDFRKSVEGVRSKAKREIEELVGSHGKLIAYGAAAKGNTFLNFCELSNEHFQAVIDKNPAKIGKLTPGSRIPIKNLDFLIDYRPKLIVLLAWNLVEEVRKMLDELGLQEIKIVTFIPEFALH